MRKLFFILFTLFSICSYAQVAIGNYTYFPDSKLMGRAYKPRIAFEKIDDLYSISVRCCDPRAYKLFDNESRVLLKFADNTSVRLDIIYLNESSVIKSYDCSVDRFGTTHFYVTYTNYYISEDVIERILSRNESIIKIRLVYGNGEADDYDITEQYQQKLMEGLKKSYKEANQSQAKKKRILNDDDF